MRISPKNSVQRDPRLLTPRDIVSRRPPYDEEYAQALEALDNNLIGDSAVMRAVKALIIKYARHNYPVLITGESGTGKELVARWLQKLSLRSHNEVLCLNCGAIAESIADTEFSGYVKGAFTGAITDKKGYFEALDQGTLFLDEFSSLPITLQKKLLRIIENKTVVRIGSAKEVPFDVRIIIGTNRNLRQMANAGEFQFDLYQRIAVLKINLPPLRERLEDLPMLSVFLLENETDLTVQDLDDEAFDVLYDYTWPGNIRELKHILIQSSIDAEDDQSPIITAGHVLANIEIAKLEAQQPDDAEAKKTSPEHKEMTFHRLRFEKGSKTTAQAHQEFLDEFERQKAEAGGSFTKTAKAMGYSRTALYNAVARAKEKLASLKQE